MRTLRFLPLLVAPLLALLTLGCGGGKKTKIAFITNNAHQFWKICEAGCRKAEAELGDFEVEFKMPPKGTVQEQRQFIEDLLAKGVKAVAVSPNNVDSQIEFFREVNSKVPLLMVDSDVDETKDPGAVEARRLYLGTDNVKAGEAVGDVVKKAVPGGGKFIIFVGQLDKLNARQRREGVAISLAGGKDKAPDEFKKLAANSYPCTFGNYTLVDTRTDDANQGNCRRNVDDELTKDTKDEIKCMIGLWAYNPPAMLEGAKAFEGGRRLKDKSLALIGFDENEETLQGIIDGEIVATVVQDPYGFGYHSVKIMADLIKGESEAAALEKYAKQKFSIEQGTRRIWVPHQVIDKANVEAFRKELRERQGK